MDVTTNPYFNVSENSETTWGDLVRALAKSLYNRHLINTPEAQGSNGVFGPGDDFYGYLRIKTVRLFELGWKVTTPYSIVDSMDQEVAAYLDANPVTI